MTFIVAIDGPAGSGKSSIAKEVARRSGLIYVDTGAIYRALAYASSLAGIAADDELAIAGLALQMQIEFRAGSNGPEIFLDETNVSREIRNEHISQLASKISQLPKVRENLLELQRQLGKKAKQGALLEGRDIGTVVFPNAKLKFFLTASAEERARRRHKQLVERGEEVPLSQIIASIKERDERDRNRAIAPLIPAKDAVLIDNSTMTKEETVQRVVDAIINAKNAAKKK